MISYLNCDEKYEFNNFLFKKYSGQSVPQSDLDHKSIKEVVGENTYFQLKPYLDKALAGEEQQFEFEWRRDIGPTHFFHVIYTPDIDDDGIVRDIHITSCDMAEQKESDKRSEVIFQYSPNALFPIDSRQFTIETPHHFDKTYDDNLFESISSVVFKLFK